MDSFTLGQPGDVTYAWDIPWAEAPLTADVDGHPMRATEIKIVLDGDGNGIDIAVRGMRARGDGGRDRRFSYRTTEPADGPVTQAAAEQFGAMRLGRFGLGYGETR